MGSSPETSIAPSAEFRAVFRAHADGGHTMTFARFMELALYHPDVGYYRRAKMRIGCSLETDFFTASTSGSIFGELICAACVKLLGNRDPRAHVFVEIGAEPAQSVLAGVAHPFLDVRTLRLGDPMGLSGDCVVFSNELLDAQPCVRTIFRNGRWRETGVRLEEDRLVEVELATTPPLPDPALAVPEGYRFDRPSAAVELTRAIAVQSWRGLFVAIDYGKTLRQLTTETPAGTARAYFRHTQSNDLLARPGEQDLTCHVCWNWIADALKEHGFAEPTLEFQEAFFIRHAGEFIAATTAAEAARFSRRKLALLQLLHPAHLGQKFQVLHARRFT